MLAALGAEVIDADQIARQVVMPGQPALAEIVEAFGPTVLLPDGSLDRKGLGARVFADAAARAALNRITHPRVAEETGRRLADASAREVKVVVYEVPLLVENRLHEAMDAVVVVDIPPEMQLRRAAQRDDLTIDEAARRLAAQAQRSERLAVADYVIDNSGPLDETRQQVEAAWADLAGGGPRQRKSRRAPSLP